MEIIDFCEGKCLFFFRMEIHEHTFWPTGNLNSKSGGRSEGASELCHGLRHRYQRLLSTAGVILYRRKKNEDAWQMSKHRLLICLKNVYERKVRWVNQFPESP